MLASVDRDLTPEHRLVAMLDRQHRSGWGEYEIVSLEQRGPGQFVAGLLVKQVEPVGRGGALAVGGGHPAGHRDVEHQQVVTLLLLEVRHEGRGAINADTGGFEHGDGSFGWFAHRAVDRAGRVIGHRQYPAIAQGLAGAAQRDCRRQFKQQGKVFGIARERACDRQNTVVRVLAGKNRVVVPVFRHQAPARLVPPYAAEMRRDPHRPADVRAELARHHAGGDGGSRPSGGTTRAACRIVRIAGAAIDRVEALPVGEIDWHVGLAEQDRTCRLELADDPGIARGQLVAIGFMPPTGRQPGNVETLLDRHRYAVERLVVAWTALGQRPGGITRAVEIAHHDRIDAGVEVLDPGECGFDSFDRRQHSAADLRRQRNRAGLAGQLRKSHAIVPSPNGGGF